MRENFEQRIDGDVYLSLTTRFSLNPEEEPLVCYNGRLIFENYVGDSNGYLVGTLKFYVVRVFSGIKPCYALDAVNEDTFDYCDLFNNDFNDWSDVVKRNCPDAAFGDFIIFDRLIVNPPFRGQEIGIQCLWTLTQILNGITLFAMRPMPLQYIEIYAKNPDVAKVAGNKSADVRKLMSYYERVGFRKLSGTGKLIYDPNYSTPFNRRKDLSVKTNFPLTLAMDAYRIPNGEVPAPDSE